MFKKVLIGFIILSISAVSVSAGTFEFKDTKTEGFIEIAKEWIGSIKNGVPDITVYSQKPSNNPLGYVVEFDSGSGVFPDGSTRNEAVYNTKGKLVQGDYLHPTYDGKDFVGWKVEGVNVEFDEQGNITNIGKVPLYDNIVFVAEYYTNPVYKVSIYHVTNGDSEFRFGPWYGSREAHSESEGHCIARDSWSEIQKLGFGAYATCLMRGCSKDISLDVSKVNGIFNTSLADGKEGNTLYFSLLPDNRRFCLKTEALDSGYTGSRIRAMLNGSSEETDELNNCSIFTESNCLFAALPEDLQKVIAVSESIPGVYDKLSPFCQRDIDALNNAFFPFSIGWDQMITCENVGKEAGMIQTLVANDGKKTLSYVSATSNSYDVPVFFTLKKN